MARLVRPGLARKFRFLLEPRALIKKCAEGVLHDIFVDVLTDREICRSSTLLDVHHGILARRLDLRKVEPPGLVARGLIRISAVPYCQRARLDDLAGGKLDQRVGLTGRKSG